QGVATFSSVSIHSASLYAIIASAAGLAPDTSNFFVIKPGPPVSVVFSQQPGNGRAGESLRPIYLDELDAYGNVRVVPPPGIDFNDQCTIAIADNATGASLTGFTNQFFVNGFDFSGLRIDKAGTYTLVVHHPA